jgi:hypothetical protein
MKYGNMLKYLWDLCEYVCVWSLVLFRNVVIC